MTRYQVSLEVVEGFQVMKLVDSITESVAEIIPEIGNNLFRFESAGIQIILPPATLGSLKTETFAAFKYGTPILFPPNRIKEATFRFRDRTYNFPVNEPPHYHLHGELCTSAWEIVEWGESDSQGATVMNRFRIVDHPEIFAYFPHSITFTVRYTLLDGRLQMETTIVNEGIDEAPFAFGLHPYFSIPFESNERIQLKIPAHAQWPVTQQSFVTGLPSDTSFSAKLRNGIAVEDYPKLGCSMVEVRNVYEGGTYRCTLQMIDRGYAIHYDIDPKFPFILLFRPDWASAFSIEPYTCLTDAFNLPYAHTLTGVQGISAKETLRFNTCLKIEIQT
jgi:aldose 1-epimerase